MPHRAMILTIAAVTGAVVAAAGLTTVTAHAADGRLEWRVHDEHAADGTVDLTLTQWRVGGQSSYGRNVAMTELRGLTRDQLAGAGAQVVRFRIVRDAGTFACEGSAQRETGAGVCDFEPGQAFAQRLRANGSGEANDEQLLSLAMADLGGAYLDELKRQHYASASVAEIVRAGQHGVGLRYLQEMGSAGYHLARLGALSDLRDHGVNARYVASLKDAGYTGLPVEQITRLRDHGVSPEFIAAMGAMGYSKMPADELVRLRDHGVSASFIGSLRDIGYRNFTTDDLVRLRDNGISATYIRRVSTDGQTLAADEIIRRRNNGER